MGGLLNKKEKVIGPHTKIGLDANCPHCGKYFNKHSTYSEMNKHQDLCKIDKEKKHLETLIRDLKKSKHYLKEIDKIGSKSDNTKKSSYMSEESNFNKLSKASKKNDESVSPSANINTDSNSNYYNSNSKNTKRSMSKRDKVKNNAMAKNDPSSGMILFEALQANINNTDIKSSVKPSKRDSKYNKNMSNFNAEYLKDFPLEEKLIQFKNQVQGLKVDWRESYCTLELDRENLLKQSIKQFNKIDPYKELHINFKGEISHDAGGIIREWFTVIFKELQKENLKLFELAETSDFSFKIHRDAQSTIENLDLFHFLGKIIAKALLDNLTVNACFNKMIYKMLLDEQVTLDDLIFIDKPLYHSLKELLKTEKISELDLYFVVQYELDGKLVSDELVPDGSNILVTNLNIDEYILKRIEHIQLKDKMFINEIKSGLYSIIPEKLLKIFTSDEFELILNGQPFIDVYDWRINSIYKGYSENSPVINNFWEILGNLSQEELARFLQFCTGSSRVPIGGFGALESNRGNISKFCITKVDWSKHSKNYIRAHTCFNRLDMPDFPTYDNVQEAIAFIIQNEILGFGVD